MPLRETKRESLPAADQDISGNATICDNCGNVYRIERLKVGDEYNDFGQRYCPFCGSMIQEW